MLLTAAKEVTAEAARVVETLRLLRTIIFLVVISVIWLLVFFLIFPALSKLMLTLEREKQSLGCEFGQGFINEHGFTTAGFHLPQVERALATVVKKVVEGSVQEPAEALDEIAQLFKVA